MMKNRRLLLALGLTALLGLSARETHAETMSLSVIYGGSTFSFSGSQTGVTADLTVLNGDLAGSGYSFTNLGGSSNNGSATTRAFVRTPER